MNEVLTYRVFRYEALTRNATVIDQLAVKFV